VLGDVGDPTLFKEIKAHKVLIMGNHDETASKFNNYFDEIYTGPLWIAEKLVLSHEPISVTSLITKRPIAINIHGHDHAGEYYDDFHINITQNTFGYEPLNLKEFIKEGHLKKVNSIHREIIDKATQKKKDRTSKK
jgi:calcineurin-like phosphoesterase family protein